MVDIMEAYNVALGRYVRLVRDTLPLYCGYECKEPEPGKFTLAFPCGPPLLPLMTSTWSSRAPEECCGLTMPCTPEAIPQYRPIQW